MDLFERILTRLNNVFDKSAHTAPALVLTYSGQAKVTIGRRRLRTFTADGGINLNYDLGNYTVSRLAEDINAQAGYTAAVLGNGDLLALTLMDVEGKNLESGVTLEVFTSPLWQALKAWSWTAEDMLSEARIGLKQLNLQRAEGQWVEAHNTFYQVPRLSGETESLFAKRILWETLKPKVNNLAIAALIEAVIGYETYVEDLIHVAFLTNEPTSTTFDVTQAPNMGYRMDEARYIYGGDYAQYGAFLVTVEQPSEAAIFYTKSYLEDIIRRSKAAGKEAHLAIALSWNEIYQTLKVKTSEILAAESFLGDGYLSPVLLLTNEGLTNDTGLTGYGFGQRFTEWFVSPEMSGRAAYETGAVYGAITNIVDRGANADTIPAHEITGLDSMAAEGTPEAYSGVLRGIHEQGMEDYLIDRYQAGDWLVLNEGLTNDAGLTGYGLTQRLVVEGMRHDQQLNLIEIVPAGTSEEGLELTSIGSNETVAVPTEGALGVETRDQVDGYLNTDALLLVDSGLTVDVGWLTAYGFTQRVVETPVNDFSGSFPALPGGWVATNIMDFGTNNNTPAGWESALWDELIYADHRRRITYSPTGDVLEDVTLPL
jgi:hypothetical protein